MHLHQREFWIKASTTCRAAGYTWILPMLMSAFVLCLRACMFSSCCIQRVSSVCISAFVFVVLHSRYIAFISLLVFVHVDNLQLYLFLCKITRVDDTLLHIRWRRLIIHTSCRCEAIRTASVKKKVTSAHYSMPQFLLTTFRSYLDLHQVKMFEKLKPQPYLYIQHINMQR